MACVHKTRDLNTHYFVRILWYFGIDAKKDLEGLREGWLMVVDTEKDGPHIQDNSLDWEDLISKRLVVEK